jgi:hypothetical protein
MVIGGDVFTKTFVELLHSPDLPAFAILGWMAISAVTSLVGPAVTGMGTYVFNPTVMFVTMNYLVLVPLLFGSYVFLIVSVGHFEASNLDRLQGTEHRKEPWLTTPEAVFQAAFFVAVLWVQWMSVQSEIHQPYPCSPWVDPPAFRANLIECGTGKTVGANDLSVPGIFYYALRGIDSFIALGLIAVVFSTLWRRYEIFGQHALSEFIFPKLTPTREVSHVGTALLACILFGSLVTAANGLGLWSVARHEETLTEKRALFFESTWVYWAVFTVAASAAAARLVIWLHQRIKSEATTRHRAVLTQYTVPLPPKGRAGIEPEQVRLHAEALGRDLAIRLQVGEVFSKAKTWPLPAVAGLAVVIAVSSQAINIGTAIFTAVLGK